MRIQAVLHSILIAAYLLFFAPLSFAQTSASQTPPQAAQWSIKESRTAAGLKFIYLDQGDEKTQTLAFAFKDGTAVLGANQDMVATLGASLLGEGTQAIEAGELDENLKDLQGGYSFTPRAHSLFGVVSAPMDKFPSVTNYMKQAMETPRFSDANIKRIRQKAADSVKRSLENPDSIASRLFRTMHLQGSPYLSFISGGNLIAVNAVKKTDIEAWHKAVLARDNLLIVTSGPMSEAQAAAEIDKIFGGLPEKGQIPARVNANVLNPAKTVVLLKDVKQSIIIAGGVISRTNINEGVARSIGVGVLSEGAGNSRLFISLREKLGATYGASAATKSIDGRTGLLQISSSVANNKVQDVIATIRQEYTKLRLDGITVQELARLVTARKTYVESTMRRENASYFMLDNMLDGRPFDFPNRYGEIVDNTSVEQVNNVINDRLPRDPLSFIVITPSAEGLKADCVIKAESELSKCFQ
jgi:zinc protease